MANSYLNRTPSSTGNDKIATFSAWVKRGSSLGSQNNLFTSFPANERTQLFFTGSDTLQLQSYSSGSATMNVKTNRAFRDVNAWYHIVVAMDSTQATASDRVKFYVNGVQETSFAVATYINQNTTLSFNTASRPFYIGTYDTSQLFFDGYMSHVSWVDGQALAPTVFGETDSTSGIWKFKQPSGVTWGTNGFHLKFENSGNLGLDSSGNSNTFSVNGNGKQALDTPSNVYATMNPSVPTSSLAFSNGNNTLTGSNASNYGSNNPSTLGASAGKYYVEVKYKTAGSNVYPSVGIAPASLAPTVNPTGSVTDVCLVTMENNMYYEGSNTGSYLGSTPSAGDIIQIALDLDNQKIFFGLNGTFVGNPATGSTPAFSGITAGETICFSSRTLDNVFEWNFGNGYFGTTAITSAGSNGNGSLFEYDVPSGYYALNTKNINTYG
jgi:hypothetical protein